MKIKIKSINGKVLFTYESEKATIKDAVEKAIEENISLRFANLSSADLRSANLSSANLSSANLRSADLSSAENIEKANLPIYCKWNHSIVNDKIKIACKEKTIEEWDLFFESNEVFETKRNTEEFKQIQAVYE
jgi:hypothetical protein